MLTCNKYKASQICKLKEKKGNIIIRILMKVLMK
jgi:hypothetical protein